MIADIFKFWIMFTAGAYVYWRHLEAHYRMIEVYRERPVYWIENIKRACFILAFAVVGVIMELGWQVYWLDVLRHALVLWALFVLTWDFALNIRRDLPVTYVGDSKGSAWDRLRAKVPWWLELVFKLALVVAAIWFYNYYQPL